MANGNSDISIRVQPRRSLIRFQEKGGKEKEIPVHHKLEEILDEYLKVSKLREKPDTPFLNDA